MSSEYFTFIFDSKRKTQVSTFVYFTNHTKAASVIQESSVLDSKELLRVTFQEKAAHDLRKQTTMMKFYMLIISAYSQLLGIKIQNSQMPERQNGIVEIYVKFERNCTV